MPTSGNIIDVSEADFEYEVIAYSQNVPVIVDFWATWCGPCKTLSPILEKLADEARGAFRLAKVDVDANPNLSIRYQVRGIPTIKAFRGGQVVAEFVGAQPEDRVREFIRNLSPSAVDLALEKAASLLQAHRWTAAEAVYREILDQDHDRPAAQLGLAKSYLGQGRGGEAYQILGRFPASKEYAAAQLLLPLAEAYSDQKKVMVQEDDPLAPAFQTAVHLAARGNILSALDGLLDILRQDRHYRSDLARKIYLALLELLGPEDPQSRAYRSDLASVLF